MSKKSYESLSEKYRKKGNKELTASEVLAYLQARMPATLAVNQWVLQEVAQRVSHPIHSFLDIGAGPGTGLLAARDIFPLRRSILVEKNSQMVAEGKKVVDADWILSDFEKVKPFDIDLVLFSYSLGEMEGQKWQRALEKGWKCAQTLVVIEPGTPAGFALILEARRSLLQWGAQMVAPCPHNKACPIQKNNWCHFFVRLARTKEHKILKKATVGWEDEKFSYVAFSKQKSSVCNARMIGSPLRSKGQIRLSLCGPNGLEEKLIFQRQKEEYKKVKKLKWGDSCPIF